MCYTHHLDQLKQQSNTYVDKINYIRMFNPSNPDGTYVCPLHLILKCIQGKKLIFLQLYALLVYGFIDSFQEQI